MIGAWRRNAFKILRPVGLGCVALVAAVGCAQLGVPGPGPDTSGSPTGIIPVAENAATLHYGVAGQPFMLDGSRSVDDGVVRTFTWRQVSGPFVFSTREGATASVTPQTAGTYVFELVVTDDNGRASVVGRQAIVVEDLTVSGGGLRCGMAVLPPGAAFDATVVERGNNSNWDSCGGSTLREASLVDGAPPVLLAIRKFNTHKGDYSPAANFKIEIDGVIQGGNVTGIYSEKASFGGRAPATTDQGVRQPEEASRVSGPGDAHYGSITIRSSQVSDRSLYEWYKKVESGVTDRKSGSIIYLDREGNEVLRVVLDECSPTAYWPYVIDSAVTEPTEQITLECVLSGARGTGADAEFYRWMHEALQGRAEPRTVVVWEVLPDGSTGRTFVHYGAFPKEWTLPSMVSSGVMFNPREYVITKGLSDAFVVEEVAFVVERVERAD